MKRFIRVYGSGSGSVRHLAFNISSLILSSPAAFPDFIPLIAVATSAAEKTSFSPKCITSCVSRVDAFAGIKRSSKYFVHREKISF